LLKNRFIRYGIFLLISFLAMVVLGFLLIYPQVIRCYTIGLTGRFNVQGNSIYISEGSSSGETDSLVILLKAANQRLSGFWGNKLSEPTIIFCHTDELYRQYGSTNGSPANYFGTPLGTYVVISPQGLNIDVISHEMCHAELTHRIGWLTMSREIPQWFNEGIALMVDYRYPGKGIVNTYQSYLQKWQQSSLKGQIQISLQDLETVEAFYKGDVFWVNLAYLRSGLAVSGWLEKVGQPGLLQFTQSLQNGASFEEAWAISMAEQTNGE
jgi:hypothetical protein